jgi:hypothetical protein
MNKKFETHAAVSATDGYGVRLGMTFDSENAADLTLEEFLEQGVSLLLSLAKASGWSGDGQEVLLNLLEWRYERRQEEAAEPSEWDRGYEAGKGSLAVASAQPTLFDNEDNNCLPFDQRTGPSCPCQ